MKKYLVLKKQHLVPMKRQTCPSQGTRTTNARQSLEFAAGTKRAICTPSKEEIGDEILLVLTPDDPSIL